MDNCFAVVVEPEYEENLGYIARAMANFNFKNLILVKPKVNHLTDLAFSRAMHGKHILQKAKVFDSFDNVIENFDFNIATSAKLSVDRKFKRVAISAEECAKRFSNINNSIAIIFGRESSGLTNEEISKCDVLVKIPASENYPTLTISHAASIIFYEFFKIKHNFDISGIPARKETKSMLLEHYYSLIDFTTPTIKNKEETKRAFKSVVNRSLMNEKEAKSMIAVFSGLLKRLKK